LKEVILTQGEIIFNIESFQFKFGRVEYSEGYFEIEIFYESESDIGKILNKQNYKKYFDTSSSIRGIDKDGSHYLLTETEFLTLSQKPIGYSKLRSFGYIRKFPKEITDYIIPEDSLIYHLDLEGLEIYFESKTALVEKEALTSKEISTTYAFSYTTIPFMVRTGNFGSKAGQLLKFTKNQENDNIILSFECNMRPIDKMKYTEYNKFSHDLNNYLSFINGANVYLRKEYLGKSSSINSIETEIVTIYSYPEYKKSGQNNYLPIRDEFKRGKHQLYHLMMSFQNYRDENENYNLNKIVDLLNDTNNSMTLNQRFYCLIIALESISKSYIKTVEKEKNVMIENEGIENLIEDFKISLQNRSHQINDPDLVRKLTNWVGGLNKVRRNSVYKIIKLLDQLEIEITPEIDKLINVFRHTSVHEGEFGKTSASRFNNYLLLDKLLRDIILNIIRFKGVKSNAGY